MSILDGILGIVGHSKNDRDRRTLNNDLLREQVTGLRTRNEALDDFKGLLGRGIPTDRLLDVEGGPATALTDLAPTAAAGAVPGTEGILAGGSVPATSTAAGQRELIGILGQLEPNAVAQSFLPAPPRANALEAKIQAFESGVGRRATEPEIQHMAGAVPETSFETTMFELELLRTQREEQSDVRDEKIENTKFDQSVSTGLDQLFEMAEINQRREGEGFLGKSGFASGARGTFSGILGGAGQALGIEGAEGLTQSANDIQRFGDLTNSYTLLKLDTGGFTANTNTKFNTFVGTKPDFESGFGPTNLRIADNLEGQLLADESHGFTSVSPQRRAETEALIKKLRSGDFENSPSQILKFSLSQIQALEEDDIKNWTTSQRNALEQAMNRLMQ